MTTSRTSVKIPIPPFADGPNGNPRLAKLFQRAAIGLFAGDMAALALTGALHSGKMPQAAFVSYVFVVVLAILAVLAYAAHCHTRPVPTRDELLAKWEADIAEIQAMIAEVGESPRRNALQGQLYVRLQQLHRVGGGSAPALPARTPLPALPASRR